MLFLFFVNLFVNTLFGLPSVSTLLREGKHLVHEGKHLLRESKHVIFIEGLRCLLCVSTMHRLTRNTRDVLSAFPGSTDTTFPALNPAERVRFV